MAYELKEHPRIMMNPEEMAALAAKADGPMGETYAEIRDVADRALTEGVQRLDSRYSDLHDMLALGICYAIETAAGRDGTRYADAVKKTWGDGELLSLEGSGHFGKYGMVYDWIYDALTEEERVRYGNALGQWLRYYTDVPEITLKNGSWWYNQTWAPAHLNTPNTRDGITPKLLVALAIAGAGTEHEADARQFLDSWATRVPAECIPAFDEMGGVWSESMGHGNYGPIAVIPWAFEAWRTATGEDLFAAAGPTGYTREMSEWAVYLKMPWCDATAWIDDNSGVTLRGFARVSPILAARYRDPVAQWIDRTAPEGRWKRAPWERFLFTDTSLEAKSPGEMGYATAKHFTGAGHVHIRSDWDDPNATWAFFGAGDRFGAHARDDEGHFLIAKKGLLVGRAGGTGHNDRDYYAGGSLAFNVVTVFDPEEEFRRTSPRQSGLDEGGTKNERDGGMVRWVYNGHHYVDRADMVDFRHDPTVTYAAADLTKAYRDGKVREVTREFVYVPGKRDVFVIFDRVEAVNPEHVKSWFLHVPTPVEYRGHGEGLRNTEGGENERDRGDGWRTVETGITAVGGVLTWVSDAAGVEDVQSTGKARAFLKTVLPEGAAVTVRGGEGHAFWGHPHEPTAQYDHKGERGDRAPVVPWRIEVESEEATARDYFLHVLEIGDEGDEAMSAVGLRRDGERVGVAIAREEGAVTLWFNATGEIGMEKDAR